MLKYDCPSFPPYQAASMCDIEQREGAVKDDRNLPAPVCKSAKISVMGFYLQS